jgi:hypothetical protein
MKLSNLFCAILVWLIFFSCNSRDTQLKSGWWKYEEGFHLGDVLILKGSNLRGDTIFIEQKPVAIVVTVASNRLEIASISSGDKGIYFHK